jgi:3-oxoacyl-[acyl-carrier-protein] synthase III
MNQTRRFAQIVGWGRYIPATILTNEDLSHAVETSDEWIRSRTGICERHTAATDESAATMAVRAAERALDVANCDPADIDLIIVATATPDYVFPSTACIVQDTLSAGEAAAFDLSAGCSGFVYALSMAADSIMAGTSNTVLVIGSEVLSRVVDWSDRSTCVLFGDGAGAFVLRASSTPTGVLATVMGADGSGGALLSLNDSGYKVPLSAEARAAQLPVIRMDGNAVYRFATRTMTSISQQVVQKAGLTLDQVDLLIPHQANLRIIQSAAKSLKLPEDKVFVNLDRYGNTSAASIPIALCEAVDAGKLKSGDIVVLAAFGAGLTWASAVVRWQPLPVAVTASRRTRTVRSIRRRLAPLHSFLRRLGRFFDTLLGQATGDAENVVPPKKSSKTTAPGAGGSSKQKAAGSKPATQPSGSKEQGTAAAVASKEQPAPAPAAVTKAPAPAAVATKPADTEPDKPAV